MENDNIMIASMIGKSGYRDTSLCRQKRTIQAIVEEGSRDPGSSSISENREEPANKKRTICTGHEDNNRQRQEDTSDDDNMILSWNARG